MKTMHTNQLTRKGLGRTFAAISIAVITTLSLSTYYLLEATKVAAATATFGVTSVQSTTENLNYNYKIASQVTAPEAGTINSLTYYIDGKASTVGSGTVAAAIYADTAGKPGALLGSSAAQTIAAGQTASWVTFNLTAPVTTTSGGKYWLSISAGTKTIVRVYRGTTANTKVWAANSNSVTPTTTFGTANLAAGPLSAYATYETATPPEPTTPFKVMPLGDSITLGWNYYPGTSLPAPGGYRTLLWQKLVQQDGKNIDFVGTLSSGPNTLGDKDHEGHSGWRIDQIRANIDSYMATAQPEAVLLTLGTNDVLQNYSMSAAPARLQDLVNRICTNNPSVQIVVSTIPPRPGLDSRVNTYNAAIPSVVTNSQNNGCNTSYFNMNSYMVAGDIASSDNTHPTMTGYDKMAEAWYPVVTNLYNNR